jgi:thiamine-phosphate pyrophosphorylase
MTFRIPRIYPILDAVMIPSAGRAEFLRRLGDELAAAGVTLLEYRNKTGDEAEMFADAEILRAAMPQKGIKLILDDRVDLVETLQFDGVHVDVGDLSPGEARNWLGPARIIGTFGGSEALVPGVLSEPADYFSIGPVYATTTKQTAKSPIGTVGVRRLRAEAGPDAVLVAVGGIKLENLQEIFEAGATTVAVAAAIFRSADPAAEFRRWVEAVG